MGLPIPPVPQKPDWMTDDEYRELIIKPCIEQLRSMQARYGATMGPVAGMFTLLLPMLIGAVVIAAVALTK